VSQEIVRGFSETREKAASMFVQIIFKPRYRILAQELVKEPATSGNTYSLSDVLIGWFQSVLALEPAKSACFGNSPIYAPDGCCPEAEHGVSQFNVQL